jgi:hypothetical protein
MFIILLYSSYDGMIEFHVDTSSQDATVFFFFVKSVNIKIITLSESALYCVQERRYLTRFESRGF